MMTPEEVRAQIQAFMDAGGIRADVPPPQSAAERKRRQRARERGEDYIPKKPGPKPSFEKVNVRNPHSKFSTASFIAIDGEGVSEGPIRKVKVGKPSVTYTGQAHYMMLLAASTGAEITATKGRLSFLECIDFLFELSKDNKNSILVAYGFSYDINQMLLYDLPPSVLTAINQGIKTTFVYQNQTYKVHYFARKCLQVWRWKGPSIGYILDRNHKSIEEPPQDSFTLWDTIGFFQQSFVATLISWLGKEHPDYLLIESMKQQRSEFTRAMLPLMRTYNQAECNALVQVMSLLRDSIDRLGLSVSRWDGAGAIAGAMNKLHNIRDFKALAPAAVFAAARVAFSGGHIEALKFGVMPSPVYHYDLNSAYPSIIKDLPNLQSGEWQWGTDFDPPPGFTLVRLAYSFAPKLPFYPLFFRCQDGSIIYPEHGAGWYWYSEFAVAREFYSRFEGGCQFDVLEWWHFSPSSQDKPFAFVPAYYNQRQDMVRRAKAGLSAEDQWMTGGEKVIKLGLNSLYGKSVQQKGGTVEKLPPYFQIEWGGYITAGCRAALMRAAMQKPTSIISFATDGLFSLQPLELDCPVEKELGKWEFTLEGGMVIAMPGVYWLYSVSSPDVHKNDPRDKGAYSRGFDKEYVKTPALVLEAWQKGKIEVPVPLTRLITMGSVCLQHSKSLPALWEARGAFMSADRVLSISGHSTKRRPVTSRESKPWLKPVSTIPAQNWQYLEWVHSGSALNDARSESTSYSIDWLDKPAKADGFDAGAVQSFTAGLVEQMERLDADDTLW